MRASLQVLLVATALAVAAAPGAAAAAPPSAVEQLAKGHKFFDQGQFEEALRIFRDLHAATGSPNVRLEIARTLRELGQLPEAHEEFTITLREASARAESEPKYAQARDAAASELALLDRRVGKIIIAIANPPSGVSVTLDGNEVAASRVGSPMAVNPGRRKVTVSAPGRDAVEREVVVSAGETKTVALALSDEDSGGGSSPPPPPPPSDEGGGSSGGGVRVAGYVVTGLGVAGLAVFGVTGLMANNKFKTLETECGGARCTDAKYADVVDSGRTLDTIATVGLIAGAAGVVLGGTMIVLGGPSESSETGRLRPRAPTATAAITVAPGGAAVRCAVTF